MPRTIVTVGDLAMRSPSSIMYSLAAPDYERIRFRFKVKVRCVVYSFLLASWGTSGNLSPLLTAARRLKRRGHSVRVMADPAMQSEVAAAGFEFVCWRRAPIGIDADPTNFSDIGDWFQKAVFGPAPAYAADIRDEIGRIPTDAVVAIDLLFGAVLGAEAAGVPIAMLAPHVSLRPLPGTPPVTSGFVQPQTPEERIEAAGAREDWACFLNQFLPLLNEARAGLGLSGLDKTVDLFECADRYLLAISETFDFAADALPDNVRYVGPLLDQPNWSKGWEAPWPVDSDRPRVLVACSTGAQGQDELVQRIISALGTLDVYAVATIGPHVDSTKLVAPRNVHLLHGAPHDVVMREVCLVVTQGGYGTVSRGLINGLPQLVLPNGRDQGDNAARVVSKGAGLRLPPSASEAEIADAVSRLLQEPRYRDAARLLGDGIKAEIAGSGLIDELEAMVANRRVA
ncbi:glycosyltransferase [Sinorhizobium psoraleae]|uniref:Glycosyltransferase n=1 Tax=Sinorhizobium psoraleae TaxID=520838 RepID=A0ABT4KML1_9HYPH|nr:glycosyltransferase [Sinorhizobium psoraleae]MCZ4093200.1 glycosyltransferase [Sinorhizobium psoraleae]